MDDAPYAALRAFVEQVADHGCLYIWQGRPPGWTCLHQQADAVAHPERYVPSYAARLAAGAERCLFCQAAALLGRRSATPGSGA